MSPPPLEPPSGNPQLPDWLRALLRPQAFPHAVSHLRVLETHISWVILTGEHAYKIKKPVKLDFLDFSTLALRKSACEEELRLNRRLAPELYLNLVAICGSAQEPRIGGDGPVLEHAVHMREFPQAMQLDRLLAAGALGEQELQELGVRLARFHAAAPSADAAMCRGDPDRVLQPVRDNFDALLAGELPAEERAALTRLRAWSEATCLTLLPVFRTRKRDGRVREVHGDLHLANLVRYQGAVMPFDCIEFSAPLRWLDVFDDLAFLLMDLDFRGRRDLAYRLLDSYLETSGDYDGLRVLRYYKVYRALVRAKVVQLRAAQSDGDEARRQLAERKRYIHWADACAGGARPAILLMHGLSGSGKTWVSGLALAALPAVRVRSDIERKRLYGLDAGAASGSAPGAGIYSTAANERTYACLADATRAIVAGGETAIVDAAFLRRAARLRFAALAGELGVPFGIVSCTAADAVLEQRIRARRQVGDDASEADLRILARQRDSAEPLDAQERRRSLVIDSSLPAAQIDRTLRVWVDAPA